MADNKSGELLKGINWGKVAVRDEHGVVDKDRTLAMVDELLTAYLDSEVDIADIRTAVQTVFDKLSKGGTVSKVSSDFNTVATRALHALGDMPIDSDTQLLARIKDFIRGESKRFEETAGEEGAYYIKRGAKGGVCLSTPEFVKEYRAFQERKANEA